MSTPIPNRLVEVPQELYDHMDKIEQDERRRMVRVLRMAYGRGYMDGYRDGHADAENGHDERVRAVAQ